jgi:hypothetical protein
MRDGAPVLDSALTGDAYLCTVRIARYCTGTDRPENAPEKQQSIYPLLALLQTSESSQT